MGDQPRIIWQRWACQVLPPWACRRSSFWPGPDVMCCWSSVRSSAVPAFGRTGCWAARPSCGRGNRTCAVLGASHGCVQDDKYSKSALLDPQWEGKCTQRGFLSVLSLALFLLLTKTEPLGCVNILLSGLADFSPV